MADIQIAGATFLGVPSIKVPKVGGGFAEYTEGSGEDTLLKALRNQVTSVEDDTLTSIRSYGLANMSALTHVSFPNLQTINTYAFYSDTNLVMDGWQFPAAKTIGNYAFRYCWDLFVCHLRWNRPLQGSWFDYNAWHIYMERCKRSCHGDA